MSKIKALKQADMRVGDRYEIVENTAIETNFMNPYGPQFQIMGDNACWFDGHGILPYGSVITLLELPNRKYVPSTLTFSFKVDGDPKNGTYTAFWVDFKRRAVKV